jgi:hypothetical protein
VETPCGSVLNADEIRSLVEAARIQGRVVGLLYKNEGRYLAPNEVTDLHLRGLCLHNHEPRTFLLTRIDAMRLGPRIETLGPTIGPPVRIDRMTAQLSGRISAAALDLVELTNRIDAMTPKQQGDIYTKARAFKELALSLVEAVDAALLEQCEMGREPIIERADGPHRLYAAPEKVKKCRDAAKAFRALLEVLGPDVVAQLLNTQPFKPAAAIAALGDSWPDFFEVIERNKLAEGGAPKKRLTVARNAEEIVDE